MSTGVPPAGHPTVVNPFYALARSVHQGESVAFAIVYAIFLVLLIYRLFRGTKLRAIYRMLVVFSTLRVGTFIVRYLVAEAKPTASNFKILLIISGVFVVAGFLFLVEAVMVMVFEWSCIMREVDNPKVRKIMGPMRHAIVAGISILGVVGAVLQITAVDSMNMRQYNSAKALRQTSGVLFAVVSLWLMLIPLALLWRYKPTGVRKGLPTAVLSGCGAALMLESVYRIVPASVTSGWVLTQQALDVLLFMPEVAILIAFVVLDFDELAGVCLVGSRSDYGFSHTPRPTQTPTKGGADQEHAMVTIGPPASSRSSSLH